MTSVNYLCARRKMFVGEMLQKCWRKFKSKLQEHEFFDVDFPTHSRLSQKNARQPNVDQRKSWSPNCHEYIRKISAKILQFR